VGATWTYEVPPAGTDASGLEDYQVETSDGRQAGKVVTVLDREGQQYVVFDLGIPPATRERRAVRFKDLAAIDHDTLTVRLRLREDDLGQALELDPANAIEGGEADAVRITRLPRDLTPSAAPGRGGPTDRPSYAGAVALFAAALITLLALFLAAAGTDFTWEFALFIVPLVLVLAAAVVAYRTFRQPYER
jgi:hypothetical protein